MMTYPKISIVTPNYNNGSFLEATIVSILSQNYPNLEYFIIDGGSTDNSIDIIKKYESQLSGWISEPDKGIYDAVNKGFAKTTGDIMAWLNSDDLYQKNSLFVVAEIFTELKEVEWLLGNNSLYNENGQLIWAEGEPRIWKRLDYLIGHYRWIQQESVFWRKSLWEKAGAKLDTNYKYAADMELWNRFFRYTELHTTRAILAGFRIRGAGQLSHDNISTYTSEADSIIRKELENLTEQERRLVDKLKRYFRITNHFKRYKYLNVKGWEDNIKAKFGYKQRSIFYNTSEGRYQLPQ